VKREVYYLLIIGHLYKLDMNGVLCKCVLVHERDSIMYEVHDFSIFSGLCYF
jgi:hypothetical protein